MYAIEWFGAGVLFLSSRPFDGGIKRDTVQPVVTAASCRKVGMERHT